MDDETRSRIFEPFFTLKEKGSESGLWLSMAYGFITGLGGFIEIESAIGTGSKFSIYLPELDGEVPAAVKPDEKNNLVKGDGTIIVIDDESAILAIAEEVLVSCGYKVLLAGDGSEGLEILRKNLILLTASFLTSPCRECRDLNFLKR